MRRALIAAAVLLAAVAGWAWRHHAVGRLTLLAPWARVENFRDMTALFPSHRIHRPAQSFTFAPAPRRLDVRYTYGGRQDGLDAFLTRTITTGFLVVHADRIIDERYFLGASAASHFTSWSVAKSFVSALVGIAIDEGAIAGVDQPITRYVPALKGSGYDGVPIRAVLQMSSGVRFDENYASPLSDVNVMFARSFLFGSPIDDTVRARSSERSPGGAFNYVSVDTQALGMLLVRATGRSLATLAEEKLWGPLGMEDDADWITDRAGPGAMEYAFCCLNARLRDYAKLGRLYLRGGDWNGRRIVSEHWVRESLTPGRPDLALRGLYTPDWDIGYQYQWWIPNGADGEFMAIGVWGQYVYVNPAADVIIAKTSVDPDFDTHDMETLAVFRAVAAALR